MTFQMSDGLFMHLLDLFTEILFGVLKACSLQTASLSCTLSFIPLYLPFVTKWCQSAATHYVLQRYQLKSKWKSASPQSSSRDKMLHAACRHTALFSINIMKSWHEIELLQMCRTTWDDPLWLRNQVERGDNQFQEPALSTVTYPHLSWNMF